MLLRRAESGLVLLCAPSFCSTPLYLSARFCGRSQGVSEAGAWSLARADPFLTEYLLSEAVPSLLTDGGSFQ